MVDVRVFPTEPWGARRPVLWQRASIRVTRGLAVPLLKQLGLAIRHVVRPTLDFVDIRLWGLRLRLAAHGNLTEGRLIFLPRSWDRVERRALEASIRPGCRFVDVGANAGAYTWWVVSRTDGNCSILAVEPDPFLVAGLQFNRSTNGISGMTIAPVAVGSAGDSTLVVKAGNRGENRLDRSGSANGVVVPTRPLHDVLDDAGFTAIDVMKIDIEGLEGEVLDGFFTTAPRSLWPRVLMTERKASAEHDALERLVTARGYEVTLRTDRNIICRLHD